MSNKRYCPMCKRDIGAIKKFSWPIFLLCTVVSIPFIAGFGGLIYICWYIIKPRNMCPLCGGQVLQNSMKVEKLKREVDNG